MLRRRSGGVPGACHRGFLLRLTIDSRALEACGQGCGIAIRTASTLDTCDGDHGQRSSARASATICAARAAVAEPRYPRALGKTLIHISVLTEQLVDDVKARHADPNVLPFGPNAFEERCQKMPVHEGNAAKSTHCTRADLFSGGGTEDARQMVADIRSDRGDLTEGGSTSLADIVAFVRVQPCAPANPQSRGV